MAEQTDPLTGQHVVVGVTGGIAAYKTAMLVSCLVQRGAEVRVVMTESAARFVGPLTFQTLSGQAVALNMWPRSESFRGSHIALADWAEACVIAPATANIMAKIAHGLADDLLSTIVLAIEAPLLLAPAMNDRMWHKAAVQENVARLGKWGYHFVGPAEGHLACGTVGQGRMAEPEEIVSALESLLPSRAEAATAGVGLKLGARMTKAVRKKETERKKGGKRP